MSSTKERRPVPTVKAPMNFGVEYLDSPAHGNLKFVLQEGELCANSAIMSFNSPVIKKMTIEFFQTEIPVQDFSKNAVKKFLEASYSGELKTVSKSNFRDLNKMAHVFEVNWLGERCSDYMNELIKAVKDDDVDEQKFLIDEAMFVWEKLKDRSFVDMMIQKVTASAKLTRNFFAICYSSCSPSLSIVPLLHKDMVEEHEDILVEVVVNRLGNTGSTIDDTSRHILEKLTFKNFHTNNDIYQQLFNSLENIENPSNSDFKLIMRFARKYLKLMKDVIFVNLPNLFHDSKKVRSLRTTKELMKFLDESPLVNNSYTFLDTLYIWLAENGQERLQEKFIDKLSLRISLEDWIPVASKYFESLDNLFKGDLKRDTMKLGNSKDLFLSDDSLIRRIPSNTLYTPEKLFGRNHDIKFKFQQKSVTNCEKRGECGFILRVETASGEQDDSFNVKFLAHPCLYTEEIHFHGESMSLYDDLHFAFECHTDEGPIATGQSWPLTWCDRPHKDKASGDWLWGSYRFGKGKNNRMSKRKSMICFPSSIKILPVLYYTGKSIGKSTGKYTGGYDIDYEFYTYAYGEPFSHRHS